MKSGKKTLYNSEEMPSHETVEEEELKFDIQTENKGLWKRLIGRLFNK